jgi:hypothetical protein
VGQLFSAALLAVALPSVADLCASCAGDSITVERRSAAFAWLDMAQGLGAALGFALGAALGGPSLVIAAAALLVAGIGVPDLHDRGTPRSTWPLAAYAHVLRSPFGAQLTAVAFFCGFFALVARRPETAWLAFALPIAGMAVAARVEPRLPNAMVLPRMAAASAALGYFVPELALLGIGVMFASIPASVARGAGEMERPVASSLAWTALAAGAAVGAVL